MDILSGTLVVDIPPRLKTLDSSTHMLVFLFRRGLACPLAFSFRTGLTVSLRLIPQVQRLDILRCIYITVMFGSALWA